MIKIKGTILWSLFLTILVVGLAGCQRAPSDKIESAQKALDNARQEQADLYATTEYRNAEETLARARIENSSGNYSVAAQLAQEAEKNAQAALDNAKKNKTAMKDEVKRMIDETRKTIDETKKEYDNAQKLKVPGGDLASTNSALLSAETELKQGEEILGSGDVITAREKVNAANKMVTAAQQELRNLVASKGAPHKKSS